MCLFIEKRYHKNGLYQIQIRPVKKICEHSKFKPFQEWERLIQQCRKCVAAPPEAASREPFAAPMDTAVARRLQCAITPHHLHLCISRYRSGSGSLVWLSHLCRLIQPFTSRSLPIAYTCPSVRLSLGLLNTDRSGPMMSTCTNKGVFHHNELVNMTVWPSIYFTVLGNTFPCNVLESQDKSHNDVKTSFLQVIEILLSVKLVFDFK